VSKANVRIRQLVNVLFNYQDRAAHHVAAQYTPSISFSYSFVVNDRKIVPLLALRNGFLELPATIKSLSIRACSGTSLFALSSAGQISSARAFLTTFKSFGSSSIPHFVRSHLNTKDPFKAGWLCKLVSICDGLTFNPLLSKIISSSLPSYFSILYSCDRKMRIKIVFIQI
jgi:hypothetical protein